MKKPFIFFSTIIVLLALCIWALWPEHTKTSDNKTLTLYCAAGLRVPVSEIIADYEKETGRTIQVTYNGSGALLSQIKIGGGDLYMPAHNDYIKTAAQQNLTAEVIPAVEMTAVIVVSKDNTTLHTLHDLTQPGVRLSFGDSSAAKIGRASCRERV